MADNTPTTPAVASAPTAEIQPEATTTEIEVPTFAKGTEEVKSEVTEQPKPEATETPAPQEEEEVTLKRRLTDTISKVEQRNEESRRFIELQADQVRENNELIHKVAATDPVLANKVIQKVWGTQGIKSYKQLLERSKLEELRTTDPLAYETKRELQEIKAQLADRKEKDQSSVRNQFLRDKGIQENEYDPNYRKLLSAFDDLNPSLVSEDYDKALKTAYSIAFADNKPVMRVPEVPTLSVGGGKKPAPLPNNQPLVSDQSSWLAKSLNEKLGYKISI